jgi:hypothetical protein
MLSDETLEELTCASASSNQKHFVIEPVTLTKCGHSVCMKCINNNQQQEVQCCICGLVSKQNFKDFCSSKSAQKLMKMCIEDVFKILEKEMSLNLNDLKGKFE